MEFEQQVADLRSSVSSLYADPGHIDYTGECNCGAAFLPPRMASQMSPSTGESRIYPKTDSDIDANLAEGSLRKT